MNKNIKIEEIIEAKILETYMFNSMQFVNNSNIKFNEYFDNLEIIKYIHNNFDSIFLNKIKIKIINNEYTKIIFDKKELFAFFENKFKENKFFQTTHIFSNNTIIINDLIFLKKIIIMVNKQKLFLNKQKFLELIHGLDWTYQLILDKITWLLNYSKQTEVWENYISNINLCIDQKNIYFLDFIYKILGINFFKKIDYKTSKGIFTEIIFPYGVYTFKYIIYMIINKFNISDSLGYCFEEFMTFFENKLNLNIYKNVNFINKDTKMSEEIDALAVSNEYLFIFEYKSSILNVFDFDIQDLVNKYYQKYKKNTLKKDKSIMNILNIIKNNKNYELKENKTNKILKIDLYNKIPVVIFVTNQFWWTNISEWKFYTSPLIIDYNFYDSIISRLNYDLEIIGFFYKYYLKNIKNKNLMFWESNINQLIMDFITPNIQTVLREKPNYEERGVFIHTDNTFLESTYQIIDLSNYFLGYKNTPIPLFCVSNHAIPYFLYTLENQEVAKKYFLLPTSKKFKIVCDSQIRNKILIIDKFKLDTKQIFSETFKIWCENNSLLLNLLDSLRSFIV